MGYKSRQEYLRRLSERYLAARNRKDRSTILDELEANLGMHRKAAIRRLAELIRVEKLRALGPRPLLIRGRKKYYLPETIWHLKKIWLLTDQMCAKKLASAMAKWLFFYSQNVKIELPIQSQLLEMSASSIDRFLKPFRSQYRRLKNTSTKPGKLLKNVIPLKAMGNLAPQAGFIEADTVAHCGGSVSGQYINSLTFTDSFSGWTENRAIWGKSAEKTKAAIEDIEEKLPFDIQSINVDNGSEFLNHHLVEYFSPENKNKNRSRFIMTRSRSYRKNDNCHAEQKNWTTVRQIFGYERLEWEELIPLMNRIYEVQNKLTNHFIPQFKLKSKVRVGAKIKRQYDAPKTPHERLMLDSKLSEESKKRLQQEHETLNPLHLREQREELLKEFLRLKNKLKGSDSSLLRVVSSRSSPW